MNKLQFPVLTISKFKILIAFLKLLYLKPEGSREVQAILLFLPCKPLFSVHPLLTMKL